jgi:hypothetical protein
VVFSAVFIIVWLGSAIITANTKLLGGHCNIFQGICVLGYCLFPLLLAAIVCRFWNNIFYQMGVVGVAFAWATFASIGFMAELVPPNRKVIAVYPVFLFYFVLGWLVLIQ